MKSAYFINRFKASIDATLAMNAHPAHWKAEKEALYALLNQAFGATVDINHADLQRITTHFYKLLDDSKLSKDFVNSAKITFNNMLQYAHTPLTAKGGSDTGLNKKVLAQTKQAC